MNNYALEQAEELFEQALEYFLGIEKEKNMIHAKELLQQSSELGLSKSSNLLGDWYIKKIIPGDNYKDYQMMTMYLKSSYLIMDLNIMVK